MIGQNKEILGQNSESNETKIDKLKQQNEKPILPNTVKGDLEHVKSEQDAENLLNNLDAQKSNIQEKVKKQVKEQAEEKGFSFDKVWKETKKAYKEKGFFPALGVFFGGLFASILDSIWEKIEKGLDYVGEKMEKGLDKTTDFFKGETPGKWNGDIYISKKGKLQIEKTKEGLLKEIKINGKKYIIETNYSRTPEIKDIQGKSYLVIGKNKISLDRLGKIIDESESKNEYLISDTLAKSIVDKVTGDKGIFEDDFELKLVREDYYGKIEKNKLSSGGTLIEFEQNIEKKKFPIEKLKIKQIIINGKKYTIEPKDKKFNLLKDGNKYLLSVDWVSNKIGINTNWDDFKIDIRDIKKQIDPKNMKPNSKNEYYLFNSKVDFNVANDIDLIKKAEDYGRETFRPDVFLLKEVK